MTTLKSQEQVYRWVTENPNISANEINRRLKEAGRGERRVNVIAAVAEIRAEVKKETFTREYHPENVRRDRKIDFNRVPFAKTELTKQYSYNVRIDAKSKTEKFSRNITIVSDKQLTRNQAEKAARNYWKLIQHDSGRNARASGFILEGVKQQ